MIESRCGILCSECKYREEVGCKGCVNIDKPFWTAISGCANCSVKACCEARVYNHCGECMDFPCKLLTQFAYDKEQGDDGKRIEQCKIWCEK